MRIHHTVAPATTTPPSRTQSPTTQASGFDVMQRQPTFTPLLQKAGHGDFSLRGLLNKLPSMPHSISLPVTSHLYSAGKDMETLGKKPRIYESNLEIACHEYSGQAILMDQFDYTQTLKTQLPAMRDKVAGVESGACLGLSMLWLLGRHSSLDDKTVIDNLLGYDVDDDKVISEARAKSGLEKVHIVQDTFQIRAQINSQLKDRRFNNVSPVIQRYNLMQHIGNMARMTVVPVSGETPFVLLNRRVNLGDGLARDVLREGREQLLTVQSDGHAMAIYTNGHDQYAFYDPNHGMFNFQHKENFTAFMNRIGKMLDVSSQMLGKGDPNQLMLMELCVL
ncbi:YopT-type cysteine protease domain-containing protein [Brenneria sp. g21c3]|uniref:YopT-type cysteine protease domain-containing protein n=1 Tax=Brenneria sp. g21c3 TaxID=3093893 RepID=UPI002EA43FA0|nr:YopT-type cysteine protease domain-containing protein [Brenneria sp. g21c3]